LILKCLLIVIFLTCCNPTLVGTENTNQSYIKSDEFTLNNKTLFIPNYSAA